MNENETKPETIEQSAPVEKATPVASSEKTAATPVENTQTATAQNKPTNMNNKKPNSKQKNSKPVPKSGKGWGTDFKKAYLINEKI
ncbi:MAG: hypothetical protein U9N30_03095, partial [Campylobacterota bacterium]|nr:hypothetical protein [Campylobacterota bacterium]